MNNWTKTIERYICEGRTVSGGCGPSSGLKALSATTKAITTSAQAEASTIFGDASTVFNNLIGGLQSIVNGGPSQAGFSTAELNAKNAAAVQAGATMERNLGGAAAASAAAIGGGNAVTPAGGTEASVLAAKTAAASQTAATENQIQTEDYEQGNKNYEAAVGQEMGLTQVFNPATQSEGEVNSAVKNQATVQTEMDKQQNWWQPMVTAAIGGAAKAGMAFATGGASLAAQAAMAMKNAGSGGGGDDQDESGNVTPSS